LALADRTRKLFDLPEGIIYLDGNSLGPLTFAARDRIRREVDEGWGTQLIGAWNTSGWMDLPERVGDRIAKLIGAAPGTVTVADSTTINLYKVLMAAPVGNRTRILTDTGNFPTDLYVAAGVATQRGLSLEAVAPVAIAASLDETVAILLLTEVDYRTGRLHDMAALSAKAQAVGALTIWDLCHSAGALPVDLTTVCADYAVGCGYKYLNGGPGAPAYIYVRPDRTATLPTPVQGWMGHASPFAFDPEYHPRPDIHRLRVGTPPILSLAALDAALDVWDGVSIDEVRDDAIALSERFIHEVERRCPQLILASPRDPAHRGSQVSFRFPEGYAAMQALIARGVIGDFRAPDIMRFGLTPLYVTEADVVRAAEILEVTLRDRTYTQPQFRTRNRVT
jgi:kynureninase